MSIASTYLNKLKTLFSLLGHKHDITDVTTLQDTLDTKATVDILSNDVDTSQSTNYDTGRFNHMGNTGNAILSTKLDITTPSNSDFSIQIGEIVIKGGVFRTDVNSNISGAAATTHGFGANGENLYTFNFKEEFPNECMLVILNPIPPINNVTVPETGPHIAAHPLAWDKTGVRILFDNSQDVHTDWNGISWFAIGK